jgi:hypothetical protein
VHLMTGERGFAKDFEPELVVEGPFLPLR